MSAGMVPAVRYDLTTYRRSGRWLGPLLAMAVVLGVVYGADPGPARSAMAATSLALLPLAGWATRALIGQARACGQGILVTALGGRARTQVAHLVAAWCAQVPLALVSVAVGLLAADDGGSFARTALLGVVLHLGMAGVGTAVGAVFVQPLVDHAGYAVVGIVGACTVLMVVRASPVFAVAHELMHHPESRGLAPIGLPLAGLAIATALGWGLSVLAAYRER